MHGLFMVGLAVLVVAVIFAAAIHMLRMLSRPTEPDMAIQVFPVWAAQGPFKSGAESAVAMHRAWLAVSGPDQTKKMADAVARHETDFDADPEVWEETRRAAADAASPEALAMAENIMAAERLSGPS